MPFPGVYPENATERTSTFRFRKKGCASLIFLKENNFLKYFDIYDDVDLTGSEFPPTTIVIILYLRLGGGRSPEPAMRVAGPYHYYYYC